MSSITIEIYNNAVELDVLSSPVTIEFAASQDPLCIEFLGAQGPIGPTGASFTAYEHSQSVPSAAWVINHNLGYKPVTQVFNSGSNLVDCEVVHNSNNQITCLFVSPITGFTRLI